MSEEGLTWYQRNREHAIAKAKEYQQKHKEYYKEYYRKRYRSLNTPREKKQNQIREPKPRPAPKPTPPPKRIVLEPLIAEEEIPTITIQTGSFLVRFD